VDLEALEANRARLHVPYREQELTIEYQPERVGMNLQRAWLRLGQPPHDPAPLLEQLAMILLSWDLARGGEPLAITLDVLGALPVVLTGQIAQAILEDFGDPKSPLRTASASASSTPSPITSTPADDSERAPVSPSSSSTPNGQDSLLGISPGSQVPVHA